MKINFKIKITNLLIFAKNLHKFFLKILNVNKSESIALLKGGDNGHFHNH